MRHCHSLPLRPPEAESSSPNSHCFTNISVHAIFMTSQNDLNNNVPVLPSHVPGLRDSPQGTAGRWRGLLELGLLGIHPPGNATPQVTTAWRQRGRRLTCTRPEGVCLWNMSANLVMSTSPTSTRFLAALHCIYSHYTSLFYHDKITHVTKLMQ